MPKHEAMVVNKDIHCARCGGHRECTGVYEETLDKYAAAVRKEVIEDINIGFRLPEMRTTDHLIPAYTLAAFLDESLKEGKEK